MLPDIRWERVCRVQVKKHELSASCAREAEALVRGPGKGEEAQKSGQKSGR